MSQHTGSEFTEEGRLTVAEFFDLITNRLFDNPGAKYTIIQKANRYSIASSLKEF